MTRSRQHLTPDEIDALLFGESTPSLFQHARDCDACARAVAEQRAVIRALESLREFSPSEDFADQVMFQIAVPDPFAIRSIASAPGRLLVTARSRAVAASVGVLLVGAMAASIIWTALNREVLASAGQWIGGEATQWFWVLLRGTFANVTEQPWFDSVRQGLGAPARLAAASAVAMMLYAGGLMALRKLMSLPSGAAHASA